MIQNICIDGNKIDMAEHRRYRGAGMVSGNNSSRLLLDYKQEHPEKYWEILEHIFGSKGVSITHLKLEMGSDINSSSGTEPAVKRFAEEKADVSRGAGYQLAADAKKINSNLTLDMLWWSEPAWVSASSDVYNARFQWYKETLEAAYKTYGLVFDYISASQNEREIDFDWIKYLSDRMKKETDTSYNYKNIKLVASDEDNKWNIADAMLEDYVLRDAIDVIGTHYTSFASKAAKTLSREYGKEIWMSEASAPMCYSRGKHPDTGQGIEMTGINGVLDIASRIIAMYPCGEMTLYEYQPVVSAYYDGVSYCEKQLITANEPWSGIYSLDSGYYMSLHFSQFIKKGWYFLPEACFCDGKKGGDGHAMIHVKKCCLSAIDKKTGDFTTVIANTRNEDITYEFTVKNTRAKTAPIMVWQSRTAQQKEIFCQNYLRKVATILPPSEKKEADTRIFSITVAAKSLTTISTVIVREEDYFRGLPESSKILPLPYMDDFSYQQMDKDYLPHRGYAPRYMTDQGGAFEIIELPDKNRALCQKITEKMRAKEWGITPAPVTNFGDDRWFNYRISIETAFQKDNQEEDVYVGVGLRYRTAAQGASGYGLLLFSNGKWQLRLDDVTLEEGNIKNEAFISGAILDANNISWHALSLEASENIISAYYGNRLITRRICNGAELQAAGRAALYSSYHCSLFRKLAIEPLTKKVGFIKRWDNMDGFIKYLGKWRHDTIGSFIYYHRTLSIGHAGAQIEFSFQGTGFLITGGGENTGTIQVEIDGICVAEKERIAVKNPRGVSYAHFGLLERTHLVKIQVLEGVWYVDSLEVQESHTASSFPNAKE